MVCRVHINIAWVDWIFGKSVGKGVVSGVIRKNVGDIGREEGRGVFLTPWCLIWPLFLHVLFLSWCSSWILVVSIEIKSSSEMWCSNFNIKFVFWAGMWFGLLCPCSPCKRPESQKQASNYHRRLACQMTKLGIGQFSQVILKKIIKTSIVESKTYSPMP